MQLLPLALFGLGLVLELAGWGFFGLDFLVATCFAGATLGGAAGVFLGPSQRWGATTAALGAAALALHIGLMIT